ncbi:hypothetical protein WDL1CHR_00740 [Variovorax sp. WDL1]|nr:hypothetical protein CHC07_02884 [Variovorax sp. B4]PNG57890.1 hypothetical protein CHC06_02886 [Variovorax sp. B2]VTV09651.1 hypothetical protein WDL1CHR_00740 [Variovorax sp. WDL1]
MKDGTPWTHAHDEPFPIRFRQLVKSRLSSNLEEISHLDYGTWRLAQPPWRTDNEATVSATPYAAIRDCEGPPRERKLAE